MAHIFVVRDSLSVSAHGMVLSGLASWLKTLNRSLSSHSTPRCFQSILKLGLVPCNNSINQYIYFLAKHRRYKLIVQFVPLLNRKNITLDALSLSYFAWALLKLGKLEVAEKIFTSLDATPSVFPTSNFWNSLIRSYCLKRKDPEKGYSILLACWQFWGVVPSPLTFNHLICSFCSQGMMRKTAEVLEMMDGDVFRYQLDNYACTLIICGFCRVGRPEKAFEFFENAVSIRGLKPNLVTYTAFLSSLCMLGRVHDVSNLVRMMENQGLQLDALFCGCWIHGYLKKWMLLEAFSRVEEIVDRGINLNNIFYSILGDKVPNNWSLNKAYGSLSKMKKHGLMPNIETFTSITKGLCRKSMLYEGGIIFNIMKDLGIEMDECVYDVLIDGACQAGDVTRACHLIDEMKDNSFKPSQFCYNKLIQMPCRMGWVSDGDKISRSIAGDSVTYPTLLLDFMKEGNIVDILNVKQRIEESGIFIDIVLLNALIKTLVLVDHSDEACALYNRLNGMGLQWYTMINGLCQSEKFSEARLVFQESRKFLFNSSSCYGCIILGLCKKNMIDLACNLFVRLSFEGISLNKSNYIKFLNYIIQEKGPDEIIYLLSRSHDVIAEEHDWTVSWTVRILCKHNFLIHACQLLAKARGNSLKLSTMSLKLVFDKLISSGNILVGLSFLSYFIKEFGLLEPFVMSAMIAYLCGKNFATALHIYDQLKTHNSWITFPVAALKSLTLDGRLLAAYNAILRYKSELSWNFTDFQALADRLCKEGFLMEALELCEIAQSCGINPPIITYNLVIQGLCLQGSLLEACRLFVSLEKIGLIPSEMTYGVIIHGLCKEGYMSDAKQYLEKMVISGHEPNHRIYNSFVYGYSKFNFIEDALQILSIMESKNISPDDYCLSALLDGYCRRGDIEGALGFFFEYKQKSFYPDLLGFLILIRGLCYKGRMEEAQSVLREMLQCQPVTKLINQLYAEDNTPETAEYLLASLCEQGMIWEAVTTLTEVVSVLFPSPFHQKLAEPANLLKEHHQDYVDLSSHAGRNDNGCDYKLFYNQAADLCTQGNISEANGILKEMVHFVN